MQLDLRTPENSWRNQLRKLGYHYDIEESDDGEETWKKSIDTTDGPKTISTCTVETCTSLIAPTARHSCSWTTRPVGASQLISTPL